MADREQVEINLKTTADLFGAKQTTAALNEIKAAAAQQKTATMQGPQEEGVALRRRLESTLSQEYAERGRQQQQMQRAQEAMGPKALGAAQLTKATEDQRKLQEAMGPHPLSAAQWSKYYSDLDKQHDAAMQRAQKRQEQQEKEQERARQRQLKDQQQYAVELERFQTKEARRQNPEYNKLSPDAQSTLRNTPSLGDAVRTSRQTATAMPWNDKAQDVADELAQVAEDRRNKDLEQRFGKGIRDTLAARQKIRVQAQKDDAKEQRDLSTKAAKDQQEQYKKDQEKAERDARLENRAYSNLKTGRLVGGKGAAGSGIPGDGGDGDGGDDKFNFKGGAVSAVRFGAALAGLGVGLSLYYFAGKLVHDVIKGIIDQETLALQATKNLNAAFGTSATTFNSLVTSVSKGGTGAGVFKVSDIQNSIASLKPLQDQLGLTKDDLDALITDAAKLADIHNIPLTEASAALSQALQGNASAVDKLGLSLSDTVVAQQYLNGKYAVTFQLLGPVEQAAARLAVATAQVGKQSKDTADEINPLQRETRDLGAVWEEFNSKVSKNGGLYAAAVAVDTLKGAIQLLELTGEGLGAVGKGLGDAGKALTTQHTTDSKSDGTGFGADAKMHFAPIPPVEQDIANQAGVYGQSKSPQPTSQLPAQTTQITQLGNAAQQAKAELDTMFKNLLLEAPSIQNQISTITGSVTNIAALGASQRQGLATRQAELGLLKQQQLQSLAQTQATYAEVAGVKSLTAAYNALIGAQQDVNALQLESVDLQGKLAQAQLAALGANRAVQDNELRQTRDRLVAQDRLVSAQERAAARRDIRSAIIQGGDLNLKAFDANKPTVEATRATEVNGLLQRIAAATESANQKNVDIQITLSGGITVATSGNINLPDDAADRIAAMAHDKFVASLNAAVNANADRPSNNLALTRGRPY